MGLHGAGEQAVGERTLSPPCFGWGWAWGFLWVFVAWTSEGHWQWPGVLESWCQGERHGASAKRLGLRPGGKRRARGSVAVVGTAPGGPQAAGFQAVDRWWC